MTSLVCSEFSSPLPQFLLVKGNWCPCLPLLGKLSLPAGDPSYSYGDVECKDRVLAPACRRSKYSVIPLTCSFSASGKTACPLWPLVPASAWLPSTAPVTVAATSTRLYPQGACRDSQLIMVSLFIPSANTGSLIFSYPVEVFV